MTVSHSWVRVVLPRVDAGSRGPDRADDRRSNAGFSLIELLTASAIAGIVLAAGWTWCWGATRSCSTQAGRVEARSSLAFVRRLTAAELRSAAAFVRTPLHVCGLHSVCFVVPADDHGTYELITYVWDQSRHVLWRKSSGSHLAEGVTSFAVGYYDAGGDRLEPAADGALPDADLLRIRAVSIDVSMGDGGDSVSASWRVTQRRSG